MGKREHRDIEGEDGDEDREDFVIKDDPDFENEDDQNKKQISSAKSTPEKKTKSSKDKTPSPAKSRWSPGEDEILIGMMEKIIKDQIWAVVKADGRLVRRTSYGVQYHAGMLLRQGTGKGSK